MITKSQFKGTVVSVIGKKSIYSIQLGANGKPIMKRINVDS